MAIYVPIEWIYKYFIKLSVRIGINVGMGCSCKIGLCNCTYILYYNITLVRTTYNILYNNNNNNMRNCFVWIHVIWVPNTLLFI